MTANIAEHVLLTVKRRLRRFRRLLLTESIDEEAGGGINDDTTVPSPFLTPYANNKAFQEWVLGPPRRNLLGKRIICTMKRGYGILVSQKWDEIIPFFAVFSRRYWNDYTSVLSNHLSESPGLIKNHRLAVEEMLLHCICPCFIWCAYCSLHRVITTYLPEPSPALLCLHLEHRKEKCTTK